MSRLEKCDSCGELETLNEFQLCGRCDGAANAFNGAAGNIRVSGGNKDDAYKAGIAAQEKYLASNNDRKDGFLDCIDYLTNHPSLSEKTKILIGNLAVHEIVRPSDNVNAAANIAEQKQILGDYYPRVPTNPSSYKAGEL